MKRQIFVSIIAALSLAATIFAAPASAGPFQPVLDEFWIIKNGTQIFRDSFNGGGPPPQGPDGATTYSVYGPGGITSESGGKLTMTPVLGDQTVITSGYAELFTGGLRLASPASGPDLLGPASSFSIRGLFDMSSLPEITGQQFGIRANDRNTTTGNDGNDTIGLSVAKSAISGDIGVRLAEFDFGLNTIDNVDFISIQSLVGSAVQIELDISKAAGSDAISASYIVYGAGSSVIGSGSLSTYSALQGDVLRIYNGENYTRAQFFSTDLVAVAEPATLGLYLIAFAAMALGRRRPIAV